MVAAHGRRRMCLPRAPPGHMPDWGVVWPPPLAAAAAAASLPAGLQEDSLLALLEGAGFALRPVPEAHLAAEYRGSGGTYAVLRACRFE